MNNTTRIIEESYQGFNKELRSRIDDAVRDIVGVKKSRGKVVVILGSGPNIHEGVTTLMAELMHKGIIDGVSTSSAVINHEMGGTLEKVKRIKGTSIGIKEEKLPYGDIF